MRYIDFHCDTLTELGAGETLKNNNKSVDIQELKRAEVLVQCCSMFVPTGLLGADDKGGLLPPLLRNERIKAECDRIYSVYCRELENNRDCLRPILGFEDVEVCINDRKTGILFTIEDGGVLSAGYSLETMYKKGVRLITLTWNHENCLGYPNSENADIMSRGLKQMGIEVIEQMNELGIIVDVSHLSDGGFYQAAELMALAKRPFVASHSNARAVTGHPRNMTDDMIRILANQGGIMGLNLAPHFLDSAQPKDGSSRIADMVRHILHIRSVGGADVLAIGSDFDGIEGKLEVGKPSDFEMLWSALARAGVPSSELEKMWRGNGLRVLSELL